MTLNIKHDGYTIVQKICYHLHDSYLPLESWESFLPMTALKISTNTPVNWEIFSLDFCPDLIKVMFAKSDISFVWQTCHLAHSIKMRRFNRTWLSSLMNSFQVSGMLVSEMHTCTYISFTVCKIFAPMILFEIHLCSCLHMRTPILSKFNQNIVPITRIICSSLGIF